ncbi:MAG: SAM-dependent chlorinase/fluorinase [Bacteroidales bacterium]|nr:SAM-dependent chlorinase/fluorinase [Bacteroidales bacterium]
MPIITLTSDWGLKDHYVGTVKGSILSKLPEAIIVDISHQIPAFNIEQASFIIKNCYQNFPKGTIHIIGINTEESDKNPHTVVFVNGHYFIGTDNGIFSMIFNKKPDKIIELDIIQDSDVFTFSTHNRFIKAAVHLAKGKKIEDLGTVKNTLNEKILFEPVVNDNLIKGLVIYIDSYENIITNIKEPLFMEISKGRPFSINFRSNEIKRISKSYNDVPIGEILALFGANKHLEIAINQGNASSLLGLYYKDPVRIDFATDYTDYHC